MSSTVPANEEHPSKNKNSMKVLPQLSRQYSWWTGRSNNYIAFFQQATKPIKDVHPDTPIQLYPSSFQKLFQAIEITRSAH